MESLLLFQRLLSVPKRLMLWWSPDPRVLPLCLLVISSCLTLVPLSLICHCCTNPNWYRAPSWYLIEAPTDTRDLYTIEQSYQKCIIGSESLLLATQSCLTLCDTMDCRQPDCLWNSLGKNTEVGGHSLHQGMFPTQGSNLDLLHCRQILYHLSHQGSPEVSHPCS